MTFGPVNASFSLPEWQAVKMTFFALCPGGGVEGTQKARYRRQKVWTPLHDGQPVSILICLREKLFVNITVYREFKMR